MSKLADVLYKNAEDPALAWRLFKHLFRPPSTTFSWRALTAISRILARARMLPEIRELHRRFLSLCPPETSFETIVILATTSAKSGLLDEAFSQFLSLRANFFPISPPLRLYNALLESSFKSNRADLVEHLYEDMLVTRVSPSTYTLNLLMLYLCDSGRLSEARRVFDKMPERNCAPNGFSFGILIRGYCRSGLSLKALELLDLMGILCCCPNQVIYNTLVSGFCREGKVEEAERLVDRMRRENLLPDVVTFNSRLSALCNAGKIAEASKIFKDMETDGSLNVPGPNQATYNIMLLGLCKEGMISEADSLVKSMKRKGFFVNVETYNIWLSGLVRCGQLMEARELLSEMTRGGVGIGAYTFNIIIFGLCREGLVSEARSLMKVMRDRGINPDTVTYSTILNAYCAKRRVKDASRILHEMAQDGCSPDTITCNILLRSLWREGSTVEAEKLLEKMTEKGLEIDQVTCNTVINGLCKIGKVDMAMDILGDMWHHGSASLGELGNMFLGMISDVGHGAKCSPDVITYSSVISALCKEGRFDEAKKKYLEMVAGKISPDRVVYETFIHGFCEHGKLTAAIKVLRDMKKGSTRAYNSLVHCMRKKNQFDRIADMRNEMRERGVVPDEFTYSNLISILCDEGREMEAALILEEMSEKVITPKIASLKCLIAALCKKGKVEAAFLSFEKSLLLCRSRHDVIYSALIRELCTHEKLSEAKQLFRAAMEKGVAIEHGSFSYLIKELCRQKETEYARDILDLLISRGYVFDPAAFIPVIDEMGKKGNKQEVDRLSALMMDTISLQSEKRYDLSHCRWGRKGPTTRGMSGRKLHGPLDVDDWHTVLNKYVHSCNTRLQILLFSSSCWINMFLSLSHCTPLCIYLPLWSPVHQSYFSLIAPPHLSISWSRCPSISLSLSHSRFLSHLSLSLISNYLSVFLFIYLFRYLYFSAPLSLCITSLSLYSSLSLSVYVIVPLSLYVTSLSLSLSLSLSTHTHTNALSLSIHHIFFAPFILLALYRFLSLYLAHSVSLCLCLSLALSISISLVVGSRSLSLQSITLCDVFTSCPQGWRKWNRHESPQTGAERLGAGDHESPERGRFWQGLAGCDLRVLSSRTLTDPFTLVVGPVLTVVFQLALFSIFPSCFKCGIFNAPWRNIAEWFEEFLILHCSPFPCVRRGASLTEIGRPGDGIVPWEVKSSGGPDPDLLWSLLQLLRQLGQSYTATFMFTDQRMGNLGRATPPRSCSLIDAWATWAVLHRHVHVHWSTHWERTGKVNSKAAEKSTPLFGSLMKETCASQSPHQCGTLSLSTSKLYNSPVQRERERVQWRRRAPSLHSR